MADTYTHILHLDLKVRNSIHIHGSFIILAFDLSILGELCITSPIPVKAYLSPFKRDFVLAQERLRQWHLYMCLVAVARADTVLILNQVVFCPIQLRSRNPYQHGKSLVIVKPLTGKSLKLLNVNTYEVIKVIVNCCGSDRTQNCKQLHWKLS